MLFKQRKPKKFSYRRGNDDLKESAQEDFKLKWKALREDNKVPAPGTKRLIVWIIALGMIIVLWYVLSNY